MLRRLVIGTLGLVALLSIPASAQTDSHNEIYNESCRPPKYEAYKNTARTYFSPGLSGGDYLYVLTKDRALKFYTTPQNDDLRYFEISVCDGGGKMFGCSETVTYRFDDRTILDEAKPVFKKHIAEICENIDSDKADISKGFFNPE